MIRIRKNFIISEYTFRGQFFFFFLSFSFFTSLGLNLRDFFFINSLCLKMSKRGEKSFSTMIFFWLCVWIEIPTITYKYKKL